MHRRALHLPAQSPCLTLAWSFCACWSCWAGSAGSETDQRKVVLSRGSPSPCLLQEHVIQSHEEMLPYEAFSVR